MNLLDLYQTIKRHKDEIAWLKARLSRITTPSGQLRFDDVPIIGLLPLHTHAGSSQGGILPSCDPTQIDIGDAMAMGASGSYAYCGHQHAFPSPTGTANVAAAGAVGSSTIATRQDHIHGHGTGYLPNAHHNQAHDIDGADHTDKDSIASIWTLTAGGRITPTEGNPPSGEVVTQVKTTTGAPTHAAQRGTLCLVGPDCELYYNCSGTAWTKLGAAGALTSHDHTSAVGDGGILTKDEHDDYSEYAELTGTATPGANRAWLYAKEDGRFYSKDDGGTEQGPFGAGGGGAPADASYITEEAEAGLSDERVLGTTVITAAAYAARQAAASAGRLFLPSDSFYIERDTGVVWAPWGPIFPLAIPDASGFAWVNQGSATVSATEGAIELYTPSNAAGFAWRIYKKAAPATPWSVTMLMLWNCSPYNAAGADAQCGFVFRESGSGKLHEFSSRYFNGSCSLRSSKWTNATTFSAHYSDFIGNAWSQVGKYIWMRIADDGTNRICSLSGDGKHWVTFHTIGRTDFLTADEWGLSMRYDGIAGKELYMTVVSLVIA